MFGLFSRNTLTLAQRATLLLTVVQASLLGYTKHRQWLTAEHRNTVVLNWFDRNGGKASLSFKAKIGLVGDHMARHLVSTLDEEDLMDMSNFLNHAQHVPPGTDTTVDSKVRMLLTECERALIAHGLAS